MALTYDAWFDILLALDYKSLKQLCENNTINKDYSEFIGIGDPPLAGMLCTDTHFWRTKMTNEFGVFKQLPDKSLLESYYVMIKAKEYEKDLKQIGQDIYFKSWS